MKKALFVFIVLLIISGCEGNNFFEDYGDAATDSYENVGNIADKASLQAAKRYIQSYRAINGKYPESIEELAVSIGGDFDTEKYEYNSASGKIELR